MDVFLEGIWICVSECLYPDFAPPSSLGALHPHPLPLEPGEWLLEAVKGISGGEEAGSGLEDLKPES